MLRIVASLLLTFSLPLVADTILLIGDSVSAEHGLPAGKGWAALLQQKIPEHKVVNASIGGETSAGGRQRLPALLEKHQPDIVIIELGGNDGLRGHPINQLRGNLMAMIEASQRSRAKVLLLGMHIPPNYGRRYSEAFHNSYITLASQYQTGLVPFALEGVATNQQLMQSDGIHPTASAQPVILSNIWPELKKLLPPQP